MFLRKKNLAKTKNVKINFYVVFIFFVLVLISLFSAANLISVIELRKQVKLVLSNLNNYHEVSVLNSKSNLTNTNDKASNFLPLALDNSALTTSTSNNFLEINSGVNIIPNSTSTLDTTSTLNNISDITSGVDIFTNIISSISKTISNIVKPNNQNFISSGVVDLPVYLKTYSNATAEPFFGSSLINLSQTSLYLDTNVTAMTFPPAYDFVYQKDCSEAYCGLREINNPSCLANGCLSESDGQIYYKNKKINLPSELQNKNIINFSFSPLETKWLVGVVIKEDNQEIGYAYLFDGDILVSLITDNTPQQIKTQYGYGGGSISAGGDDKQFIILYTGYEGFGYLYNNGDWQDLSTYFGLRVTKGGFKAKVIKAGTGTSANWYICSADLTKPKLIKLWQNDTKNIQGALDLSAILEGSAAICTSRGNREINIARNLSGQNSLYIFKDKGFSNNGIYRYQSANLSDYVAKKIVNVRLSSIVINARPNSYSFFISPDAINWQLNINGDVLLNNNNLETFYVKAEFQSSESEYSPWFHGIGIISYSAQDKN